MKMNESYGEKEDTPPEVKDLAHEIGRAINELTPDGTEFSCLIILPGKGSDDEPRLVVATNQSPQGLMEVWHNLVKSIEADTIDYGRRIPKGDR